MANILILMFSAVFIENFIFSKFMGCCPFLGVSEKPDTALGMGMAVTFVMTVASAATYGVYQILVIFGLEYLDRGYEDLTMKLKRLGADIQRG